MSDVPNNHDEPSRTDETAPTDSTASNHDDSREKVAWALFALLAIYVGLHPFLPGYAPDAAIVGAIVTGIVSLLATRALGR